MRQRRIITPQQRLEQHQQKLERRRKAKEKPAKNYYQLQKYAALKYDYGQIAEAHRETVQSAAVEIRGRLKRTVEDMIEIGGRLIEVKALVPGEFTEWLEGEFDMSISSANEFMNIAKRFADFSTIIVEIAPTAIRMLAAPSVKDQVISAVIEATQAKGKPLLVKEVRAIRDAIQPRKPKQPKQLSGPVAEPDAIEAEYSVIEPEPEPANARVQLMALALSFNNFLHDVDKEIPGLYQECKDVRDALRRLTMAMERKVYRPGEDG